MRRLGVLALLAACGRGGGGKKDGPPVIEGHTDAKGPVVSVRADAVAGGHVAIVENRGDAVMLLRRELVVEVQARDGWAGVDASSLYLRDHCDTPGGGLYEPPACVEVAAGATLRVQPWTDSIGDAQCACEECGPVSAGTYRFVVLACDGGARTESATFAITAP